MRSTPLTPIGQTIDSRPGELCVVKNGHYFKIISVDEKASSTPKESLQQENYGKVPPHEEFKRRSPTAQLALDKDMTKESTPTPTVVSTCKENQTEEEERFEVHERVKEDGGCQEMKTKKEQLTNKAVCYRRIRVMELKIEQIFQRIEAGEAIVQKLSQDVADNSVRKVLIKRFKYLSKYCDYCHKRTTEGEIKIAARVDKLDSKLNRLATVVGSLLVQSEEEEEDEEEKEISDEEGNFLQIPEETGNLPENPKEIGNLVPIKGCMAVSYISENFGQEEYFRDKKALLSFSEEIENPNPRSIETSNKMNYSDGEGSKSMELSDATSPYNNMPTRERREIGTSDDEESEDEWADQLEGSEEEKEDSDAYGRSRGRSKEDNDPEDDFIDELYGQPIVAREEEEDSPEPSDHSPSSFSRKGSPDMEVVSCKKWNSIKRKRLGFKDAVSVIPRAMPFEEAWEKYNLEFYWIDGDTKKDIRDDFIDVRLDLYPPESSETIRNWVREYKRRESRRCLYKVENPGRFHITIVINGVEFRDVLCDTGSCINIMSREVYQKIGARGLKPSKIHVGMADASCKVPDGVLKNVMIEIGECDVPTDFQVIDVSRKQASQIILGTPFLNTTGAVMDWPRRRMFFANIDKKVFYDLTPNSGMESHIELRGDRDKEDDEEVSSQPRRRRAKKACPETSSSLN